MKTPRIANAVGHIDDELVCAAAEYKRPNKTKSFIKWGAIAACFAAVVLAVVLILPMMGGGEGYKGEKISLIYGQESAIVFPWEYKTTAEKYGTVIYRFNEYTVRGEISEDKLGESIGTCMGMGNDPYTDKIYTESFDVRKISGISEDRIIAAKMDEKFYVCVNRNVKTPATFGELLDLYNLAEVLPLAKFSVYEGYKEKDHFKIANDDYVWQILSECREAEAYANPDSWNRGDRNYLCFTATSEELGIYKKVFYITADGYVSTNIFNYAYVYFIGKEAAGKIIDYAKSNAVEAEAEPYNYTLAGTLTEIGDGYILIDDTVLCTDKSEGKVWRVLTDDLRLRRCYEIGNIGIGDIVVVTYRARVAEGSTTVTDAFNMEKGTIFEGDVAIPE